jgi:hypothetical protein
MLHNVPEEQRSHLHYGGSLKLQIKKNYNLQFIVTNCGLDHQIYIPSKDSNVSVYQYVQVSFRVNPALYSVVTGTVFLWVK